MARIVSYTAGVPAASQALSATSDVSGRHEGWRVDERGAIWSFWVAGDVEEFVTALPADPSVASHEALAERNGERLFEVRLPHGRGAFESIDGVDIMSARFDRNGSTGRVWCESDGALSAFRDAVTETCGWFEVSGVYELATDDSGRTVHVDANGDTSAIVAAILETVADAENVSVNSLPPLYDCIDPDLVASMIRPDGNPRDHVSFEYADRRIVVRADGTITVS